MVRSFGHERVLGRIVFEVDLFFADLGRIQRGLGDVAVASLDHLAHLAEEERQKQSTNVASVDVGVSEANDLVIAALLDVKLITNASTNRGD